MKEIKTTCPLCGEKERIKQNTEIAFRCRKCNCEYWITYNPITKKSY